MNNMNTVQSISNPELFNLVEEIAALEAALLSANPQMPHLLRTIHKQLASDAELTTLLTEEQIEVIVHGLIDHTKVELMKASAPKKKALKSLGVGDL